jgi:hypothetical protein
MQPLYPIGQRYVFEHRQHSTTISPAPSAFHQDKGTQQSIATVAFDPAKTEQLSSTVEAKEHSIWKRQILDRESCLAQKPA